MRVLGIETSCDETAVCLMEAAGDFGGDFKFNVLGNALNSQAALHAEFGGVFPNLARREHAKNLVPMLQKALDEAGELLPSSKETAAGTLIPLKEILEREPELFAALVPFALRYEKPDIDVIAVTHGPGLEPALWVGINFARALSILWDVPIVAVNHMEGHIIIALLRNDEGVRGQVSGFRAGTCSLEPITYPMMALLISGGHTELVLSKSFGTYELVGQTRDDAAGEAFDKVARLLGLSYPGGPEVSRLATLARRRNEVSPHRITLPRPMIHENNFDFSFSGLKTAVRRMVESELSLRSDLGDAFKMQVAREFEDAVTEVLVTKTLRAIEQFGASTLVVGGGVSANTHVRLRLAEALAKAGDVAQLLIPPPELATDNAIMIALAGYFRSLQKEFIEPATLRAQGNLRLG